MPAPRIIILTPGQVGSNPRTVKEAWALHKAGFEVHVIASRVLASVESRDQEIVQSAPFSIERIDLARRRTRLPGVITCSATKALEQLLPLPSITARAHDHATGHLIAAACRRPADLYIAHYVAALPAAMAAARRHGARFAFDAEDFHPGDLPDTPENAAANRRIDIIERAALPRAAYVAAAAPGIADAYAARYGIPRPTVIRNVFPRAEAPPAPTAAGTVRPGPTLYWFSQTRGADRGLECALEAVARAKTRPHLHLRGQGRTAFDTALLERASALGCADRVHLLDPAAPSQMVPLAARYDAGLVGETGVTENRRIALTNKQFTYLLAGIPAVMSDIPAHVAFAGEAEGAAFLYRTDDPVSLADALDRLFENPERLAQARARAWNLGRTTMNWEAEAPRLVEAVERALGAPWIEHARRFGS